MLNIKGRQAPLDDPDGGCINLQRTPIDRTGAIQSERL